MTKLKFIIQYSLIGLPMERAKKAAVKKIITKHFSLMYPKDYWTRLRVEIKKEKISENNLQTIYRRLYLDGKPFP